MSSTLLATSTLAAFVAAVVSAGGWLISQLFLLTREAVSREINARTKFVEHQIGEFYAPLYSLACQIIDARSVRDRMTKAFLLAKRKGIPWDDKTLPESFQRFSDADLQSISDDGVDKARDEQPMVTIRFYVYEKFILQLYDEALKIINKAHLLGKKNMPEQYRSFMQHAIQSRLQNSLYKDKHISSGFIKPPAYKPEEFLACVEEELGILMGKYMELQGQVSDGTLVWNRLRAAFGLNTKPINPTGKSSPMPRAVASPQAPPAGSRV